MSFEYIQQNYQVPAEKGRVVEFTGGKTPERGVVVGCRGHYIKIQMDGEDEPRSGVYHPTWEMRYLEEIRVPKVKERTRSQRNYQEYLAADPGYSFAEWMGFRRRR